MSRIHVLIKDPGKRPRAFDIENELHTLQHIVGGYIETVHLSRGAVAIVDEEGLLKGKEPNMVVNDQMLVGTIIFCGDAGEDLADIPADFEEMLMAHEWE